MQIIGIFPSLLILIVYMLPKLPDMIIDMLCTSGYLIHRVIELFETHHCPSPTHPTLPPCSCRAGPIKATLPLAVPAPLFVCAFRYIKRFN